MPLDTDCSGFGGNYHWRCMELNKVCHDNDPPASYGALTPTATPTKLPSSSQTRTPTRTPTRVPTRVPTSLPNIFQLELHLPYL